MNDDRELPHNHVVGAPEKEQVGELIDALSAYIEHYHGGWVRMVEYDGRVLKVQLGGACEGCRLSETTIKGWIGGTVHQFFPDVEVIEAVNAA